MQIPVSALWAKPYIISNSPVRIFEDDRDVTDIYYPVNHARNREVCELTNHRNAQTAARLQHLDIKPPYYHYDALSGRALEIAR